MLRSVSSVGRASFQADFVRYVVAIISVGLAFVIATYLQRFPIRSPFVLIYLAAIALSFWHGRRGPGLLASMLATVCLSIHFLSSEHRWPRVAAYDLPILCFFAFFVWWIQAFSRSRQQLEQGLVQSRDDLEAAVKERTDEAGRISAEYHAKEAERQMLTTLVEQSPNLIAVTDNSGNLSFINEAGRHLLGIPEQGGIGQVNFEERLSNQQSDVAKGSIPLLTEGHFDLEMNPPNSPSAGTMHLCFTAFLIPLSSVGGSLLRAFVAQDVTKRTEAEHKLRRSLEENRRLLEENKLLQEKQQHENITLQERNLALQSEIADIQRARFEKIIGESPSIRRTLSKVEQVAATDVTVLITGETGTGKELIAQAIHENSKRAEMPFRAINCAAFPTTLMASELFGHERGAFTGADRQRLGQFELAAGGTLFLDEIGELPLETQAMLLRVLEEQGFERLGGTKRIRSDVRIIVATNRDLHAGMQKGEFRRDLFFRLNGFPIEVPPLRERRGDIPLLVQHFVLLSAERHGKHIRNIEKRAMEMLLAYSWPGNIRELRNVINMSVVVSPGEDLVIDEELLFGSAEIKNITEGTLDEKLAQYERSLIERALTESHGRISGPSGAATLLGMPGSTLTARIKVLRIDAAKFKIQPE